MHLTAMRNWWEFAAPPIGSRDPPGGRLRRPQRPPAALRLPHRRRRRPDPHDPDFAPPLQVEPHHLVTWAGRWYLVAYALADQAWRIYRVDRIHPHAPPGRPFAAP